MSIQCCVERGAALEEQEGIPDKEADVVKFTQPAAIPWYGNRALLPPPRPQPSRIVTSLPRTVSNATTLPTN